MIRQAFGAVLLIIAFVSPSTPASAQIFRSVDFAETPGVVMVAGEGAEVTLRPLDRDDDASHASATVRIPGYLLTEVTAGGGTNWSWVGIGRLSASDPAPSILLGGFTGGANCCATLKLIVPEGGRIRVLDFDGIEGAPHYESFPADVDRDGVVDLVGQDNRFRYAFSSGAGSLSPPLIFNVQRGRIVDVSTLPPFRPMWEHFASEARAICADQSNEDRNGGCAAYVAAAARLGRYSQAMREVETLAHPGGMLPEACNVALADHVCPAGRELRFSTFPSALTWFLRTNGYIE
jgi:hypothetical protein